MKAILIFACIQFIAANGFAQNWQNSSHWKMYDITTTRTKRFHRDSLPYYRALELKNDSMRSYLTQIRGIPPNESVGTAWMGDYWLTCNIDSTTKVLRVSRYGGFFVDFGTGLYYELPEDQHRSWQRYLNDRYIAVRQL